MSIDWRDIFIQKQQAKGPTTGHPRCDGAGTRPAHHPALRLIEQKLALVVSCSNV